MKINGNLVDIHSRSIIAATIDVSNGIIASISGSDVTSNYYILPGLIDAHVHIESSMLTPAYFAEMAVRHGTIGVVSDPHEIANILGIKGVEYMIKSGLQSPVYFWFGAPSCVPATDFETSGASLGINEISELLNKEEIKYLSEVMNFPGVIYGDIEIGRKIKKALELGKPVDGHAPGLRGEMLEKYINAGISTDHECGGIEEAREKIGLGMKILIREGSAAKDLDALKQLYNEFPEMVMLCSDDLHPHDLIKRHINKLISKLVNEGYNIFDVLRSCTINPITHYGLKAGMLRRGDSADFIIVDDIREMNIIETWIGGEKVFDRGKVLFNPATPELINNFNCSAITEDNIRIESAGSKMQVIEAFDGDLITGRVFEECREGEIISSDISKDILKIVVKNRYADSDPAVGFIKGFGLKSGAMAGSVSHDSHNIVCVGVDDSDIVKCVNEIIALRGGLAVTIDGETKSFKLDIAGIISAGSCVEVASAYNDLSERINSAGCSLSAPFMTLSFMSLLVIPELKIGDRGLFHVKEFRPTSLFVE